MGTLTPFPVIEGPAALGLRYGLFTAATGPLSIEQNIGVHGFGSGVSYKPTTCGNARRYPIECPVDVTPPEKTFDPADPYVEGDSFIVYAGWECKSVGQTPEQLETSVRQRLRNGEQNGAEAGLADQLAAEAVPLTADDPDSIRSTIGELEQWLYGVDTAGYGNVGFIHAPARYAAFAGRDGLIRLDGRVWKTPMGTIVVFGGGYPDDGRLYISGQVTVWRADEPLVPPARDTFNHRTNTYRLLAEREYIVTFDCVAASVVFTGGFPAS